MFYSDALKSLTELAGNTRGGELGSCMMYVAS